MLGGIVGSCCAQYKRQVVGPYAGGELLVVSHGHGITQCLWPDINDEHCPARARTLQNKN